MFLRLRLARRLGLLGPTLRFERRVEAALLGYGAAQPSVDRQPAFEPAPPRHS
jgi:hypothetical protein